MIIMNSLQAKMTELLHDHDIWMKSIGIGIGDISPALTCYRIDTSCPVAPTCSGFRYFLVPWTANSSCRDPARCGDNKLFAYRGGAVSRRRLANKKLLTICKTLTWCQAALCFRLLSATAAEGKQRRVFLFYFFISHRRHCCHVIFHVPKT